jgi:hypothetical protein
MAGVTDDFLRALPLVGSVDQVSDSTDVLSVGQRARQLRELFVGDRHPDRHGEA